MQSYPILFRIVHAVRSDRFEALVATDGRALMVFEDDEVVVSRRRTGRVD